MLIVINLKKIANCLSGVCICGTPGGRRILTSAHSMHRVDLLYCPMRAHGRLSTKIAQLFDHLVRVSAAYTTRFPSCLPLLLRG